MSNSLQSNKANTSDTHEAKWFGYWNNKDCSCSINHFTLRHQTGMDRAMDRALFPAGIFEKSVAQCMGHCCCWIIIGGECYIYYNILLATFMVVRKTANRKTSDCKTI